MLRAMLTFELRYHFRQLTWKIAALLFLLLGMLGIHGGFGGEEVHTNAPYVITVLTGLLSLFSIFVSTLFCANVVLRDTTHKMDAILFTTSVERMPYFSVRFVGLLLSVFIMLLLSATGMLAGSLMTGAARRGPVVLYHYLQPLVIFGLPNILFICSLIFSTALLTRNMRATYAAGVLLYILYLTGSILGNSPLMAGSAPKATATGLLSLLPDPFGLAAFFSETKFWSVQQRNSMVFTPGYPFLLNRLLWSGFSLLVLAVSYRSFAFGLQLPAASKQTKQPPAAGVLYNYHYRRVCPEGLRYAWAASRSQVKLEMVSVFKHIPFMVMLLLWIFYTAIELKDHLLNGFYGIMYYPVTSIVVSQLRPVQPALLLMIFYAAELRGRERAANMQEIIHGTPVPNAVLWGAKCMTLALLAVILVSANIGTGIVIQLSKGYFTIELPVYLSLFYYSGLPLFLCAVLFLFIQTLTPNKYLGMLLSVLAAGILLFSRRLGISHYLLRYAAIPDLQYSNMNGFGHYAKAFSWYMLYWGSLAAILSLLTIALWRGRLRVTRRQYYVLTAAMLLWISSGIYIYYETNVVGRYWNKRTQLDWELSYEQKYKPLSHLPQPVITKVKTYVDLYPGSGRYTVKGSYLLKNVSDTPISKIWVGIDPEVTSVQLFMPATDRQTQDTRFRQYWFQLRQPLLPGAVTSMQFSMEVVRSGFTPFNTENSVVKNGTYIELEKYVPFIGYNDRLETDDAIARKERGLPLSSTAATVDSNYYLIDLETTISTAADQHVVTVGALQGSWNNGGRRYFNYKTTAPVDFMFAISSARYSIAKEIYKGIELSVCYQPGETYNVAAIMQAMKDALDYCSRHFSPYPLKQLVLAGIPQYRGAATAYPGVVFSSETINFLADYRDSAKTNHAYAVTVHEVSHQWWANQLIPAAVPGRDLLTESLAKYTEAMVLEHTYGKTRLREYLHTDNRLYFMMRNTGEPELPLVSAAGQAFVHYQKGGLALYTIKEALGEERIDSALQHLLNRHAYPGPKAVSTDLVQALYQEAAPGQAKLIDECLQKVIVHDLKITVESCKLLPDGKYKLLLRVNITKTDEQAGQTLLPDEDIDIAVFDAVPDAAPLYLQKHHFGKAATQLSLVVNKKPSAVAIDPYGYILDVNQEDNMQELK